MSQDGPGKGDGKRAVDSAPTEGLPEGFLALGQVLGERYEVREQLGRGGMGEVWRAFDLKLRVEVALKAMLPELFKNEKRRDMLRREVRAAREVVSPNVCRIFDLIEVEGRELVSMEYVDGRTLLSLLAEQGPLSLKEAQDIASQFLAGLEAIHQAGLVHRDVKPENIMITRAGRVVLMDFGLARQEDSGEGTIAGTPAYMAPEQAAGLKVDARADVYSAGVVLAEMVSPDGVGDLESRQSVWEGIREVPARVPDTPWAPVLKKAVAKERDRRQNSAHTLIRELEDVTLRVEGAEDLTPYPGLASFTEADAEYFFGREAEVEQMWARLDRPHLLGIVGPSGAGKTSFIRAGVIPNAGAGWAIATCTPGNAAISSLGRVMARELAGDADAVEQLLAFDDLDVAVDVVSRWRNGQDRALLVVDQFEELFTLNSPEEQKRFASLLGRLVLEADVFVLLSMRDDFFFHCHRHEALKPVVSDLTLLGPPEGAALRRALVQPATKCGYRFEDDELIEEMLAEVGGERGTLPLLAFAAARLWAKRDRDGGMLPRRAYRNIGGVGGALAKHAEDTVEKIGSEKLPIVRELFRNLVTAEGTRAVREWNALLSIFSDSKRESQAEAVLRQLIDARLLTSYEIRKDDEAPTRSVEIVHESLLANWPRLVRWQTQDADAAQLRDQLRQAAMTWDEHHRSDDLLWTGSAYREFAVWRERYPGGLTETEEAFAKAMTAFATRRRRRRRIVAAAAMALAVVLASVFASLWQRSVREARRAEAQKLLALGQLELDTDPSVALAWGRASLEVFDTREGRIFALRALENGPIARVLTVDHGAQGITFSPDGAWLAVDGFRGLRVFRRSGGPVVFGDTLPVQGKVLAAFDRSSRHLSVFDVKEVRTYDVPGFTEVHREALAEVAGRQLISTVLSDRGVFLVSRTSGGLLTELHRPGGPPETVPIDQRFFCTAVDESGEWAICVRKGSSDIYILSLVDGSTPPRRIHTRDEDLSQLTLHPDMDFMAIQDEGSGLISLWPLDGATEEPLRTFKSPVDLNLGVYRAGPRVVSQGMYEGHPTGFVWDLSLPQEAEPLRLRTSEGLEATFGINADPETRWLVAATGHVVFWPLPEKPRIVFPSEDDVISNLTFTPDGKNLMIPRYFNRGFRVRPLDGSDGSRLLLDRLKCADIEIDPGGKIAYVGAVVPAVAVCPLDGSEPTWLDGFDGPAQVGAVAYDPVRRLVAGGVTSGPPAQKVIRVWNLRDGSAQVFGPTEAAGEGLAGGIWRLDFLADGSLVSHVNDLGVVRWRLEDGSSELVFDRGCRWIGVTADGGSVLGGCGDPRVIKVLDVETNEIREFEGFPGEVRGARVSPDGELVAAGYESGEIRIRHLSGGASHLLLGYDAPVQAMTFSPDSSLLATADRSGAVRVWQVPDISRTPFHALPYGELLAKLDEITNVRVIRDEESPTGWKVDIGPFPGWETVPSW